MNVWSSYAAGIVFVGPWFVVSCKVRKTDKKGHLNKFLGST